MKRGEDRATSLRRLACLVILPASAVAPVFAGFRTRDAAPAGFGDALTRPLCRGDDPDPAT